MKLQSTSFADGTAIPTRYAFGKYDPESHVTLTDNVSPHLAISDAPTGTRSYAILCVDADVPSRGDDVNQEGKTVPHDLPRVEFAHLVLFDLPASVTELAEGLLANGITTRGKGQTAPHGARVGLNDYTGWFAGDDSMQGDYFGYDGPCPPWNDERLHHYTFTAFALDVDKLAVAAEKPTLADVREAMKGHILAKASIGGSYAIYPQAR